jgi:acyl-coenzyme A thioesterase PaaI-like protein
MIGEELRAIADLLVHREVDDDTVALVTAHLDAARTALAALPHAEQLDHDRIGPWRGIDNVVAPPLVFGEPTMRDGVRVTNAIARCGARYEGRPGVLHGGVLAACFDEVLAVAQRDSGGAALTKQLEVRYRRPVAVDDPLVFTAWLEHDDGRRAMVRGACHVGDDLCADAAAELVRPR